MNRADVTFRCPECGRGVQGPPEWKQWCSCKPTYEVPDGLKRDLVEMQPIPGER